jgi:hypothetical protein
MFSLFSRNVPALILLSTLLMSCIAAQEMTTDPASLTIPDGTPVELQLTESVSSAHARVGDLLDFVVVKDVSIDGFTVIPAGTVANGSVTGVKGKRFLGIGGHVALKLDSVKLVNGEQVSLRGRMLVKGHSRTKLMVAGMVATGLGFLPAVPVFLLTRGHDSTVLRSTKITAYIDGVTSVPSAGLQRSVDDSSQLDGMMDYLPPRVFNAEGHEGDMLNLIFVGQQKDLQKAFERAGWVKTDKFNVSFVWHLLWHGTHDARLPMSRLYLFGRVQDYSYALPDPGEAVARRHHIRIWKTDTKFDGMPVWAGSATRDIAIEIAKRGRFIGHRIDPAVDAERDFVGIDLTDASSVSQQEYLHSPDPVYQAQTTSGQTYHSDGRILLLDLHPVNPNKINVANQPSGVLHSQPENSEPVPEPVAGASHTSLDNVAGASRELTP